MVNEGMEARKKEEEVASRKRKVEEEQAWEGTLSGPQSVDASTHLCSCSQSRTTSRFMALICQYFKEEEEAEDRHPWMNKDIHCAAPSFRRAGEYLIVCPNTFLSFGCTYFLCAPANRKLYVYHFNAP